MRIYLVLLSCFLIAFLSGYSIAGQYQLIRVPWQEQLQQSLTAEGWDITLRRPGAYFHALCTNDQLSMLQAQGVFYTIIQEDLVGFYQSRLNAPRDIGGYHTFSETMEFMDSLHLLYPHIVAERESIGITWEGNIIWAQKISDNPSLDEDEPEVLYDALIHAREAISHEQLIYFMRYLCQYYGSDDLITYLVNNRELWFIPVFNPDGFLYNENHWPAGGGIWRKNRRNNGDGTFGVDLNRNFGYMWGYDDIGSSPSTSDQTYRGPSPFSEPETQYYRDFVNDHQFILSFHYHSYQGLYLFPWGYDYLLADDYELFMEYGIEFTRFNSYIPAPATDLYPANGTTIDWMYGDTSGHHKTFAYIIEVGGEDDGFWPPEDRIVELCEATLWGNIKMAEFAGIFFKMIGHQFIDYSGNNNGFPDQAEQIILSITARNAGFQPGHGFYITLDSASFGISILSDSSWIGSIPKHSNFTDYSASIVFEISEEVASGSEINLYLTLHDTSGYYKKEIIVFNAGTPIILFFNDFNVSDSGLTSIEGPDWEWGIPYRGPENAYSPDKCWGTKLSDNYSNSSHSILQTEWLHIPADYSYVNLSFWHWYYFEASGTIFYDGGNLQFRTAGSPAFELLHPENGYDGLIFEHNSYLADDSGFGSISGEWIRESFDLTPYIGDSLLVRFILGTDPYVSKPGWYIDDLKIIGYTTPEVNNEENKLFLPSHIEMNSYPNPFNSYLTITINGEPGICYQITCLDISGRQKTLIKEGFLKKQVETILWTPESLSTGLYFISLKSPTATTVQKVLYLR
ncbi:hypothetical protein JW877_03900 [bacterium]|nr:hypothetical protein [bacterium]